MESFKIIELERIMEIALSQPAFRWQIKHHHSGK